MNINDNKDVKLSADVEPFIPQNVSDAMSPLGEGPGGTMELTPIPSYLITCYPFIQENQPNRQLQAYNTDFRWQQPNHGTGTPYLAYPFLSQPPVSSDYTYYQLMPAACPPFMGFYQPFPPTYGLTAPTHDCGDCPPAPGSSVAAANQKGRGVIMASGLSKQQLAIARRPQMRSVVVQKEFNAAGTDGRSKTILLVDAAQQTDSPGEVPDLALVERPSPLTWSNKGRWRWEPPGKLGTSEADVNINSSHCSTKHIQASREAKRSPDPSTAPGLEAGVMTAVNWASEAHEATHKPWADRSYASYGGGKARCEQRLCTQDEDVLSERLSERGIHHPYPDPNQPQLDILAQSWPISIVQTPIPVTTSVPKRAKSQKKKALAAALATAQEYSEISMEQKKLQDALNKAAGKKSRAAVQLDLGDMLAALERQQQAMKARQFTNTKPLSYTVGTTVAYHSQDLGRVVAQTGQLCGGPPQNIMDSTTPRGRRGKEREVPKAKRPTALKKVILKEREGQKDKCSLGQDVSVPEEGADNDLSQEGLFQDENGRSLLSDSSLSPASQNSPCSITPVSQGSPGSTGMGSPMTSSAVTMIHSRRFREYCNQVLNKEIDESTTLLLQELVRFQERVNQRDPGGAKTRRRLVMGLREVTKHMRLGKIKCVIISPNCEKIQSKGGLDEALYNVITMARDQGIPFVFALGRKALGRCVNKLVPVSVVGIFSFSGAEGLFDRLVSLTEQARKAYRDMVSALEQEQAEEALRHARKLPHHMGHSRNPSAASAISFCSVVSEPISEVNEREYETNWRNMVEPSDGQEAEESPDTREASAGPPLTLTSAVLRDSPGNLGGDLEERRPDDSLEKVSQQIPETGFLDGRHRDPPSSFINSATSTLVPDMLEEDEEDENEEEVPALSRIESWVSETLENLQLGKAQDSSEDEEEGRHNEEEELDSIELIGPTLALKDQQLEVQSFSC